MLIVVLDYDIRVAYLDDAKQETRIMRKQNSMMPIDGPDLTTQPDQVFHNAENHV